MSAPASARGTPRSATPSRSLATPSSTSPASGALSASQPPSLQQTTQATAAPSTTGRVAERSDLRPWRLIVRHVEVDKSDPLRFESSMTCSLRLNEQSLQVELDGKRLDDKQLEGKKLVFDQGVDLKQSDARRIGVDFELTLAKGFSALHLFASTEKQRAKKAQSQLTYRGSLTYAELCSNAVQYRVPLQLVSGTDAGETCPQYVDLVVWCFEGFAAFKQVGNKLVKFGDPPPEVLRIGSTSTDSLEARLLKLLRLANHLDSVLQIASALHPAAQAAYSLVSLSLVFVNGKVEQRERAQSLVNDMESVVDLIGNNIKNHHEEVKQAMHSAALVVEQASLWLLRYREDTFMNRTFSLRVRPELEQHTKDLRHCQTQLRDRIACETSEHNFRQAIAQMRRDFPVASGSRLSLGKYRTIGDPGCIQGTRIPTLQSLIDWLGNEESPNFLLLEAGLGSGKSSVAEQFLYHCPSSQVLATFRFKAQQHGSDEPRGLRSLISALVRSIGDAVQSKTKDLVDLGARQPGISDLDYFEQLICELPSEWFKNAPFKFLIIIDDLDYSADPHETTKALAKWINAKPQAFKVLITGRNFTQLLGSIEDPSLVQHQLLRSDDAGVERIVEYLCDPYVAADVQTRGRLVEAAQGLPLWVARVFLRIKNEPASAGQLQLREPHRRFDDVLYRDFVRFVSKTFLQPIDPSKEDHVAYAAEQHLKAARAILAFLSAGVKSVNESLLRTFFPEMSIVGGLDLLRPLLKGTHSTNAALTPTHTSLISFLASNKVPPRLAISTGEAQIRLMRRCFDLLRKELRPLCQAQQLSQGTAYAVKYWTSHWLKVVRLEDANVTAESIVLLYDFVSGEGPSEDGKMPRDDPRIAETEQRGGFASWAEAHYKLQQSPDSNISSPSSVKAREISEACAVIAQKSPSLADKATHCTRILDEYSALAERIEEPSLDWKDDDGEPCSGDASACFWFSLLAAAPRSSLLFQHVGRQRASPRVIFPDAESSALIVSRVNSNALQAKGSAPVETRPPNALRLKSSKSSGRDVLLSLVANLLVLRLQSNKFVFVGASEKTSSRSWILAIDEDEPVLAQKHAQQHQEESNLETRGGTISASSGLNENPQLWTLGPLGTGEAQVDSLPKEELDDNLKTLVKSLPNEELLQMLVVVKVPEQSAGLPEHAQQVSHRVKGLTRLPSWQSFKTAKSQQSMGPTDASSSISVASSTSRSTAATVTNFVRGRRASSQFFESYSSEASIQRRDDSPLLPPSSSTSAASPFVAAMSATTSNSKDSQSAFEFEPLNVRLWHLIVRSVELSTRDSLRLQGSSVSLKLNAEHLTASDGLTFDQSIDLQETDKFKAYVDIELSFNESTARVTWLQKKSSSAAARTHTYRGRLAYADLDANVMEYRVVLLRRFGDPQRSPQEVQLVIWCFSGFTAYRQEGDMLVKSGECPPEVSTTARLDGSASTWFMLKPNMLKLLRLTDHLDSVVQPVPALHSAAQAAYSLVSLSFVFVNDKLQQHERAKDLVDDMQSVVDLIGNNINSQRREVKEAMHSAALVVEQASLWLLRYGESAFMHRRFPMRARPMFEQHTKALRRSYEQLSRRLRSEVSSSTSQQEGAWLRSAFPVALESQITPGDYRQLGGSGCIKGTRISTLQSLVDWLGNESSPTFLLLEAGMGFGKSSVVEQLLSHCPISTQVLATFRFKTQRDSDKPRGLSSLTSALGCSIGEALPSKTNELVKRSVQYSGFSPLGQFEKLICELPGDWFKEVPFEYLVIMDDFDDSANPQETTKALAQWINAKPQAFKVLITGRNFTQLLGSIEDHSLVQRQLLHSNDAGVERIVEYLCDRYVAADEQTRGRLVEAAQGLPLWVTRAFERIVGKDDMPGRLRACAALLRFDDVLYQDFQRSLNIAFPQRSAYAAAQAQDELLLEAFHAIAGFMLTTRNPFSKRELLDAFPEKPYIEDGLERLRQLLKGGSSDEDLLSPIHSSFFAYLVSDSIPRRFRINEAVLHPLPSSLNDND